MASKKVSKAFVDFKKAEERQLLMFDMTALRKILDIHIMDKMRNEHIRRAVNLSDTIVQKSTRKTTQMVWGCTPNG